MTYGLTFLQAVRMRGDVQEELGYEQFWMGPN